MKVLKNSFEGENVKYYDMFFLSGDKVQRDITYLMKIIKKNNALENTILDVGCGTGAHAYSFSEHFKKVYAIDISEDMISYARMNHKADAVEFDCLDIVRENTQWENIDVAVSLAHVIGYQLTNVAVKSFLSHINHSLKNKGLLIFSFYNLPAIYLGRLEPRTVTVTENDIRLSRISNARIDDESNCLALDYYYIIDHNEVVNTYEVHEKMRCFTMLELDYYLAENGFEPLSFLSYGTDQELTGHDWNGVCIAQKISSR